MSINNTPEAVTERLNAILDTLEDKAVADDLFSRFYLLTPIDLEKVLYRLNIPDAAKAQILTLSVHQILPQVDIDLAPLVARSMDRFWERLAEETAK